MATKRERIRKLERELAYTTERLRNLENINEREGRVRSLCSIGFTDWRVKSPEQGMNILIKRLIPTEGSLRKTEQFVENYTGSEQFNEEGYPIAWKEIVCKKEKKDGK